MSKALIISLYALLTLLSVLIGIIWVSTILVTLWTTLLITAFYLESHHKHLSRKQKQQKNSQAQASSYFDNIWHRPADSTQLEYQKKKFQSKKKKQS